MISIDLERLKLANIHSLDDLITYITPLGVDIDTKEQLVQSIVSYYAMTAPQLLVDEGVVESLELTKEMETWNLLSSESEAPKIYSPSYCKDTLALITEVVRLLQQGTLFTEVLLYVNDLNLAKVKKMEAEPDELTITKSDVVKKVLDTTTANGYMIFINAVGFKGDELTSKELWKVLMSAKKGHVITIIHLFKDRLEVDQYTVMNQLLRIQRLPYLMTEFNIVSE